MKDSQTGYGLIKQLLLIKTLQEKLMPFGQSIQQKCITKFSDCVDRKKIARWNNIDLSPWLHYSRKIIHNYIHLYQNTLNSTINLLSIEKKKIQEIF